jgi:formamidopyrimidine-DNA glycosylase
MLFQFRGRRAAERLWLGVHLGMSGELRLEPPGFRGSRHDHLILRTGTAVAVYTDPRMFGRIDLQSSGDPPAWWARRAPAVLSREFSREAVAACLRRRKRSPVKAVLLQQDRFPGVGNWMADEILWRAGIHPARAAGSLDRNEAAALWRACRQVCRAALKTIGGRGGRRPSSLNERIPRTWLFWHRWAPGGRDPRTGTLLRRATIGGRTTVWSPSRQER